MRPAVWVAFSLMLTLPLVHEARSDTLSTAAAVLPSPRDVAAAVSDGSVIYLFGGNGGACNNQGICDAPLDEIVRFDPTAGQVTVVGTRLPTPRHGMSAVWTGSVAYVFGGWEAPEGASDATSRSDQILRYDPSTDSLTTMSAVLPTPRAGTDAVWVGDAAYIFGGYDAAGPNCGNLNEIVRYHPASGSVQVMNATLPTGRAGIASIWDGRHAYIFGGVDCGTINQILRYDPATDSLVTMSASFPSPRLSPSAAWDGEHAYIFGGWTGGSALAEIVKYTPASDQATLLAIALPSARDRSSAAFVAGATIYVLGGNTCHADFCSGGGANQVTEIIRYDIGALLPATICCTSAIWDGNHAYVFGGEDSAGLSLDTIVRFNPSNGHVSVMGARLPGARQWTSAAWTGSYAYIFGGFGDTDEILRYDPQNDAILLMSAKLPTPRQFMAAVWDGTHVYLFGGFSAGVSYDEILRYNPLTDTIDTMQARLPSPRHATSAAWDGEYAYIFGGQGGGSDILRYHPATDSLTRSGASLPGTRIATSATWDGRFAYVFGGISTAHTDQVYRFNPRSDSGSVLDARLPQTLAHSSAVWTGTSAWLFGGRTQEFPTVHTDRIVKFVPPANRAPSGAIAHVPAVECTGTLNPIQLEGSAFSDPDDDPLTFSWSAEGVLLENASSATPTGLFPLGGTSVELTVSDGLSSASTGTDVTVVDTIPPVTTAELSGEAGNAGWWRSPVAITLSASDSCGVDSSEFSIDDEPFQPGTSIEISGQGNHTIRYRSTDRGGNVEAAASLALGIDSETPVTSHSLTAALGENGWWRSPVTVELTCADSTSGCISTRYRVDNGSTETYAGSFSVDGDGTKSVTFWSEDAAGNQEPGGNLTFRIDATPPVVGLSDRTPANAHHWNQGPVTVVWTCVDMLSGSVEDEVQDTLASEGADQSTTGTCEDLAGNTASDTVHGIHIDLTPPAMTGQRSPQPNAHGWNNGPVSVTFACTDSLSGVDALSGPTTLGGEGADQAVEGRCTDLAGNEAGATVDGLNIDLTAPSLGATRSPPANAFGWSNEAVTVSFECSDALAGVETVSEASTLPDEGEGQAVTGTCQDRAGNAAAATVDGIHIDLTAPTLATTRSPVANAFGWNNEPVTVSFDCSDGLSGVESVNEPVTRSGEGPDQEVDGRCADKAGNEVSEVVDGIHIDLTAPSMVATRDPPANAFGWNNGPVTVSFACSDALAGVDAVSEPLTVGEEGPDQSATGVCQDRAGNSATTTLAGIHIDLTPPQVEGSRSPEANAHGWNNGTVTARFGCTDALSGVSVAPPSEVLLQEEGGDQSVTGTCEDRAGNEAAATLAGIHIDLTIPDLARDLTGTEGLADWWRSDVVVELSCHDALSGRLEFRYVLDGVEHEYQAPFNITGDGAHTLAYRCSDRALNHAHDALVVLIDTTPPEGNLSAPWLAVGPYGIPWTAADATSGIGSVELQERSMLLNASDWRTVCSIAEAGHHAEGTCVTDPEQGRYCYRIVVIDVAGNTFDTFDDGLADPGERVADEARACTLKAGPQGLPASLSVSPSEVRFNVTTIEQEVDLPGQETPGVPGRELETPAVNVSKTCAPAGLACIGPYGLPARSLGTTPEVPSKGALPPIRVSLVVEGLEASATGLVAFSTIGPLKASVPTPFGELPVVVCEQPCPLPMPPSVRKDGEVVVEVAIGDEVRRLRVPLEPSDVGLHTTVPGI